MCVCVCVYIHCRLLPRPFVTENFQYHSLSRPSSAARETVDFSTSSLPHRVGSANQSHSSSQSHRSSYYDSSLPVTVNRNTKLSNGRLGTVSPYEVSCSPTPGWSHHSDNISSPDSSSRPARVAANLPMRHHLAHVPLNAIADQFPSNDQFRYSCREHAAPPPSPFHRIVSLPTRHQRRYAAVPARSAQV